ncbi:MAG: 4-hydroxybenzoate octaprenyltransferase [Pseudomonadota bacterium]|jgi:4-hydroxybenzoate polyprenyltransferase|nr:4-hydroxybenzoate octaprenyltransferase [Rhodobiaceae bacterium]MEC9075197.1 4-hydroxybenzoate octaprenyltransferase [Pseudomonadota bacterium]MED5253894.1 4-hydroxybenzoate octaprenyltransferase [Pseudomonadota bacterium]MED5484260.1 4-hydroxybenzoate octaprenyltransferase [Pseudomonadota bacterium]|tara:strand:- start:319 stop:1200 length:882 start_codon:yes stop_codon:yes gene_type:complete
MSNTFLNKIQPFVQLARYDKPIGFMLLFWPCIWSLLLYSLHVGELVPISFFILFFIGSIIMRGAGCTWNDFLDKDYDKSVKRTKDRPLASSKIKITTAIFFLIIQLFVGLLILIQFNKLTIIFGCLSLIPVFIYPLMKRITWWPQVFLGITFNWGALLGWMSVSNNFSSVYPLFLYIACIFWTIGYDTIYAHQDKDDDLLLNLKSSAIKLGENTKYAMLIFYSIFFIIFAVILLNLSNSLIIHIAILSLLVHLVSQIIYLDIDNSERCLKIFKSNNLLGIQISFFLILEVLIN